MILRLLTGFSAICFAFAALMFLSSWRWAPNFEWRFSDNRQVNIDSRLGTIGISDIQLFDADEPTQENTDPSDTQTADTAKSIDQKVRNNEIEVVAITPLPWYDFLLFDSRTYKDLPPSSDFKSWRWVQIPYWPLLLLTGILPAVWLVRYKKTSS